MRRLFSALAACLALISVGGHLRAGEYCVSCSGPDAVYRCKIEGTPDGPGQDPRAQLLCIRQLAESGAHESCSVARNASYPCPGDLKVIAGPVGEIVPPPAPIEPLAEPAVPVSPPAGASEAPPAPQVPPKTVEELAGQTAKSSKEGLKKAGETISGTAEKAGEQIGNAGSAVGNAAKKTWNCLTSLFSDC